MVPSCGSRRRKLTMRSIPPSHWQYHWHADMTHTRTHTHAHTHAHTHFCIVLYVPVTLLPSQVSAASVAVSRTVGLWSRIDGISGSNSRFRILLVCGIQETGRTRPDVLVAWEAPALRPSFKKSPSLARRRSLGGTPTASHRPHTAFHRGVAQRSASLYYAEI